MATSTPNCTFCGDNHPFDRCLHWRQIQLKACPICRSSEHYWRNCPRQNKKIECKAIGHATDIHPKLKVAREQEGHRVERHVSQAGVNSQPSITIISNGNKTVNAASSEMIAPLINLWEEVWSSRTPRVTETNHETHSPARTIVSARASSLMRGHSADGANGINRPRSATVQSPQQRCHADVSVRKKQQPPSRRCGSQTSTLAEDNYLMRLGVFDNAIWPTLNEFVCPLCATLVEKFQGIIIKDCQMHKFCRDCIRLTALESPWLEVRCPFADQCDATINHDELYELLAFRPDLLDMYLSKRNRHDIENDLTQLDPFIFDQTLLVNLMEFDCSVCLETIPRLKGVSSKACGVHYFCRDCMRGQIRTSEDASPRCPGLECEARLLDVEVKELDPENYERLQTRGLERVVAAAGPEAQHCMIPDCKGLWFIDETSENKRFRCPVCEEVNCLACKIVHVNGQSCEKYREDMAIAKNNKQAETQSQAYIDTMLKNGRAMLCPVCTALVVKETGCDALKCIRCHTELCWATKGPRWGPGGRGDVSGGCRCRHNGGPLCHPSCKFCH